MPATITASARLHTQLQRTSTRLITDAGRLWDTDPARADALADRAWRCDLASVDTVRGWGPAIDLIP